VPVVSIMRTADITAREALGGRIGTFIGGESPLLDPCGIVPDGEPVDLFAEFSVVTLDVTITDFIGYRANQMYLIIKYVMMTAQSVLHKLGYVDLKRLNGVDQVQSIDAPAGGLLHTRTLTYQMKHPDFVASLPTLVELVKQRVETLPVGVSTGPTLGTDI
jgi:hypothetical protein